MCVGYCIIELSIIGNNFIHACLIVCVFLGFFFSPQFFFLQRIDRLDFSIIIIHYLYFLHFIFITFYYNSTNISKQTFSWKSRMKASYLSFSNWLVRHLPWTLNLPRKLDKSLNFARSLFFVSDLCNHKITLWELQCKVTNKKKEILIKIIDNSIWWILVDVLNVYFEKFEWSSI